MDAAPATGAQLVGVRAYARLIGVTAGTISRQVRSGAIPNRGTPDKPLIDPVEANEARARNLNPLKARNRGGPLGYERSLEEADAALSGDRHSPPPGEDEGGESAGPAPRRPGALTASVTAAQAFKARHLQFDLAKKAGKVVDRGGVVRAGATVATQLHERLRVRNRTLAEMFAVMNDPREILAKLEEADLELCKAWAAAIANALPKPDADAIAA